MPDHHQTSFHLV